MAAWTCAECTATYSVGAPKCPECGSVIRVNDTTQKQEDDDMAKITVHGGPSNAAADEVEAGEDVATESSSETAPAQESSEPETPAPSRARTTGSRSKKAGAE